MYVHSKYLVHHHDYEKLCLQTRVNESHHSTNPGWYYSFVPHVLYINSLATRLLDLLSSESMMLKDKDKDRDILLSVEKPSPPPSEFFSSNHDEYEKSSFISYQEPELSLVKSSE
jgi:hypothetical protein